MTRPLSFSAVIAWLDRAIHSVTLIADLNRNGMDARIGPGMTTALKARSPACQRSK
jgi:hypothetical protein